MKIIFFIHKTSSIWSILFKKWQKSYVKELKVSPFLKQKRGLSLRKCLLQKAWNQYRTSSHLVFFIICRRWRSLDKFLWLHTKTGYANFSFWRIIKATDLKDHSLESTLNTGQAIKNKEGQLELIRHWSGTSRFVPVTWLKINSDYFCFGKRENILQKMSKIAIYREDFVPYHETVIFESKPWFSQQNCKT